MKTQLVQDCSISEDSSGVLRFKIENTIAQLNEGDLPQPQIFLHRIEVPADPKADVFMRIATLSDLTLYPLSRDAALAAGEKTYLSAGFAIDTYTDLPTAVQGKQVIQARIDDLIAKWKMYQGQFKSPVKFEFPLADTSIVKAAKEALREALTDRDDKAAAVEKLKLELLQKRSDADAAASKVAEAAERATLCTQLSTQVSNIIIAVSRYRGSMETFIRASETFRDRSQSHQSQYPVDGPYQDHIDDFAGSLSGAQDEHRGEGATSKAWLQQLTSEFATQCAAQQAALVAARATKQAADAAVGSAQTKVTLAEAALTAAQAAVDTALVSVKNYCPAFDPAKDL